MKYFKEKNLFLLAALANLIPLWLTRYTASLDGPQHLYLSQVMVQLWQGNATFESFYQFSSPVIGNQTGNLLLALLNAALPAWLAEKLLLTGYVTGLAYAFRYMALGFRTHASLLTFLIFPFAWHGFMLQGYYNFSLAFIGFFFFVGWWTRNRDRLNVRRSLIMGLLLLLIYYTHVFVFGLLLFVLALMALTRLLLRSQSNETAPTLPAQIKQNALLLLAALPTIVLTFLYYRIIPDLPVEAQSLHPAAYLGSLKILIAFVEGPEMQRTLPFLVFLAALFVFSMLHRINFMIRPRKSIHKGFLQEGDFWLIAALVFAGIIFLFTDSLSTGSMMERISLAFFLAIIAYLSLQPMPKWVEATTMIAVIVFSLSLRTYQHTYYRQLDKEITELLSLEAFFEKNEVIMSINFSTNWVQIHHKNYIGSNKPIVNLHTEAVAEQFIIGWNKQQMPDIYLGALAVRRFNDYSLPYTSAEQMVMQKVVVWGYKVFVQDDFEDLYKTTLLKYYDLQALSPEGNGALFVLKNHTDRQQN